MKDSQNKTDKIIILVIDDNPGDFTKKIKCENSSEWMLPKFSSANVYRTEDTKSAIDKNALYLEYGDNFEIFWIRAPQEGKCFRDLFLKLDSINITSNLSEKELVPDIICLDYSFFNEEENPDSVEDYIQKRSKTKSGFEEKCELCRKNAEKSGTKPNCERSLDVSYLRRLRRLAEQHNKIIEQYNKDEWKDWNAIVKNSEHPSSFPDDIVAGFRAMDKATKEKNNELPSKTTGKSSEHTGLYFGIPLYLLYSHRYSAVLLLNSHNKGTIEDNILSKFFAYFYGEDIPDIAKDVTKFEDWKQLINPGVQQLRKKIYKFCKSGIMLADLQTLLKLNDENAALPETITLFSRFGKRTLPLPGLFIDQISPELRLKETREWGKKMLVDSNPLHSDVLIKAAVEKSEELFARYCHPDYRESREKRFILSNMVGKTLDYWRINCDQVLSDEKLLPKDVKARLKEEDKTPTESSITTKVTGKYLFNEISRILHNSKVGNNEKYALKSYFERYFGNDEDWLAIEEPRCMKETYDVRSIKDGAPVKKENFDRFARLTMLFTFIRLCKLLRSYRDGGKDGKPRLVTVDKDIVFDLFYPIPTSPLVLPWTTASKSFDPQSAWRITSPPISYLRDDANFSNLLACKDIFMSDGRFPLSGEMEKAVPGFFENGESKLCEMFKLSLDSDKE